MRSLRDRTLRNAELKRQLVIQSWSAAERKNRKEMADLKQLLLGHALGIVQPEKSQMAVPTTAAAS